MCLFSHWYLRPTLPSGLPITFEENRGQVGPEVAFLSRTSGYRLFLTRHGAVITLNDGQTVRINLANSRATPLGMHLLAAKTNYLLGLDPAGWRTGIANYERVTYRQAYPGIDVMWHAHGDQVEQDFVVSARADPRRIRLVFAGSALRLTPQGDMTAGSLRFHKPRAFQDGREIECAYELRGNAVHFALGAYHRSRPLTIDPILSFSTYLGAGNVFVAGQTNWPNFSVTAGAFQQTPGGGDCSKPFSGGIRCTDIFVAKFRGDGKTLLSATYLGGQFNDSVAAIAVGPAGNLYLTGTAGSTFPKLAPLPGQPPAAFFVAQLSADLSSLLYATALPVMAKALAVDAAGAVYLTGATTGGLPVVNAFQPAVAGSSPANPMPPSDAFVMKLDATASNILHSTYLGGTSNDSGNAIAVDAAGRAYVAGETDSPDFPLAAPLQPGFGGKRNAFITVLDPGGARLVWSTYLGGSDAVFASSIALDAAGDVHLAGLAGLPSVPPTSFPAADAFAAKIKGDGSAQIFSARLAGSSLVGVPPRVAADAAGNTYIADTPALNGRPAVNSLQPALAGETNVYVAEYNGRTGGLEFATYLGGSGADSVAGMSVDAAGSVYLVGQTTLFSHFPLINPWHSSFSTVFVAKIGATPSVTGLMSAASYTPIVTPGEIVSLFGTAMASTVASATQLPLPTQLSDVQVTINGVPAPLFYASPQQVNAQIPFETRPGPAQVQVISSAGTATMTMQVAATAPAIFTLNQQGAGHGAIQHGITDQLVTDGNPAAAGEIVSIYCTGLGALNPPAQTGGMPPVPPPQTLVPVQVSIGGVTEPALYAGVAPGFPGLYQVNAQIPAGTPSGAQPLQIIQNGAASNTVTVVVH